MVNASLKAAVTRCIGCSHGEAMVFLLLREGSKVLESTAWLFKEASELSTVSSCQVMF